MRLAKKQEFAEAWQLDTSDIASAPWWFKNKLKSDHIILLDFPGGTCFWVVETKYGKVVAFNGDYVCLHEKFQCTVVNQRDVSDGVYDIRP